jgi:hypothetical protein
MKGRYVRLMIVLLVSVVSLLTAGQFGEGLKGGIWQATIKDGGYEHVEFLDGDTLQLATYAHNGQRQHFFVGEYEVLNADILKLTINTGLTVETFLYNFSLSGDQLILSDRQDGKATTYNRLKR